MPRLLALALLATPLFSADPAFQKNILPFLTQNCLLCHNAKLKTGGLNLEQFTTTQDLLTHRDTFERVLDKIRSGTMPPPGARKPAPATVQAFTRFIQSEFARADKNAKPDPGSVTARRLNRYEYNNTVRDLLAVNFRPADNFPADDSGYGFDNIGDVLSLSPVLMEKYLAAAEQIAKLAIPTDPLPKPTFARHLRSEDKSEVKGPGLTISHSFPVEGDYYIQFAIGGRPDPMKAALTVDGTPIETNPVESGLENRRVADFKLHVALGDHLIAAELIPDGPRIPDPKGVDSGGKPFKPQPNPSTGSIEIRGPYNPVAPPPSESYKRIFLCGHSEGHHTLECARTNLAAFARRAYRRPVSDDEIAPLVHFVEMAHDQGDSFEQGMRIGLEAILVSPHFLFRIERDSNSADIIAHNLDDFELATRLSYFLWSSTPDDELSRQAAQHTLRSNLEAQIHRMLRDPKSKALVENFGGQWLQLRNLDSIKPDPDKFPIFTDDLRHDMKQETELFFESILHDNRSLLDFIGARYTYLNERLASFYGIPGVQGPDFRRVELPPGSNRGGLLGQASILTVSSYPARTSPVIRGKWVLENILNAPPPPPPANVPNLDENAIGATISMRKQLEQHRADPICSSCHARMDPLGFGLENYDAIGQWRTHDGKFPIDATGTLPNGKSFQGPAGLKELLASDKDVFTQCLAEKMLTYALGRGLERYDRPAVQSIVQHTAAAHYKFTALIDEIAKSVPFQMRRPVALVQGSK